MATEENIAFGISLETGLAVKSFATLKAEARALEQVLSSGKLKGDAFAAAATQAAKLRDAMRDAKDTIAAFHPERKFQAFTGAIQGVAGGFAAAQGAMALFGNESEDLQKTLLKVQGAMALSQGLNSLMGMGDAFKNLKLVAVSSFATIRTAAIATFTTIKGAMISTGVGALVVALGFLVQKFIETSAANKEATEKEKEYTDATKKAKEATDEKVAALNLEILAIEKKTNLAGATLLNAKAEKLALEERLETVKEADRADKEAAEKAEGNYIISKRRDLESSESLKEKLALKEQEIYNLEIIADRTNELEGVKKTADAAEKARLKVISDAEKAKDLADKKAAEKIEEAKKNQQRYFDFLVSSKAAEKDLWEKVTDDFIKNEEEKWAKTKGFRDAEKEYDDAVLNQKRQSYDQTSALLIAGSKLAGEQSEAGKAMAVSATLISTWATAQDAYASAFKPSNAFSPILGAISAAAAVASGLANVQAILSVNAQGQTSIGGGNTSAPPPMTRPQSSRVSFDSNGKPISVSDKSRQRVYVVERDITNAQNRVALIQARSKIG